MKTGFQEQRREIYPNYTKMFDFAILEGDTISIETPGKILISQSLARKYFGNESAVGKLLVGDGWSYEVGGVYKDFPLNSVVKNVIYAALPPTQNIDEWRNQNYELYVMLDSPESVDNIIANFKKNFKRDDEQYDWNVKDLQLTQLPEIYYQSDSEFDSQADKGSYILMIILFSIAVLVVVTAGINFTNFSNAIAPMRVKSINTQKVFGNTDRSIRLSLLTEAITICLVSFGLSVLLVESVQGTWLESMIRADLSLQANIPLLLFTALLSVIVGMIAGLYPSWQITRIPTALALKGSYGLSPSGRKVRDMLVGFQFVISFGLIVVALFVYIQNYFMIHSALGFNTEQVAIVELNGPLRNNNQLIRDRIVGSPDIRNVSFANILLSGSDRYPGWG